jgi:hypothetical protein
MQGIIEELNENFDFKEIDYEVNSGQVLDKEIAYYKERGSEDIYFVSLEDKEVYKAYGAGDPEEKYGSPKIIGWSEIEKLEVSPRLFSEMLKGQGQDFRKVQLLLDLAVKISKKKDSSNKLFYQDFLKEVLSSRIEELTENDSLYKGIRNLNKRLENSEINTIQEEIEFKVLESIKEKNQNSNYKIVLYNSDFYKIVDNKIKPRAYSANMSDELIEEVEKVYKRKKDNPDSQNSFVNIAIGDLKTGKSWGETYDRKGQIGMSNGTDYCFPLLVTFRRGEDGFEDYDFLNEKTGKEINKYLEDNDLNISDVLDFGGGILSDNILMIKAGLEKQRVVYKLDNFQPEYNWDKIEIEEIESKEITETIENGEIILKKEKKTKKYLLIVEGQKEYYSKHDSLEDLISFANQKRENDNMSIKKKEFFLKKIKRNKKEKSSLNNKLNPTLKTP